MSGKIKVGWEVKKLGLLSQKEVLDFVLFFKKTGLALKQIRII